MSTDAPSTEAMSKREYIATHALQTIIRVEFTRGPQACAQEAVRFADALLAELARKQP